MSDINIMSGINQIPYEKVNIMKTLKEETIKALGQVKWDEIIENIGEPADNMESEYLNNVMRELLKRYDFMINPPISKNIFCNVKHGLKHTDFYWAREKFME